MSNTNDKKYTVYLHTLSKDDGNMYYVGITCRNPEERWGLNGSGYKYNAHFYRAITKYGWCNFKHEILAENLDLEDACALEKDYILLYNSFDPEHGYNKTEGGLGGRYSSDWRFINKKVFQFSLDYVYIACYDSITQAQEITGTCQISSGILFHRPRNNFLWGCEDDVYFENNTYHLKCKYKTNKAIGKKAYQFDREGHFLNVYESYEQAARENNIDSSVIKKSIGNEFRSYYHHEHLWRKESQVHIIDGIVQDIELRENEKPPKDQVFQFDLDGVFINSYLSTADAAEKYSCHRETINSALKGRAKTACGYLWRDIDNIQIDENGIITIRNFSKNEEQIYQFDLHGNYINSYNSRKKVCEKYGMLRESLDNNLHKKVYSSFGYIWRLEKDIIIENGQIRLKDEFTEEEKEIYKTLRHAQSKIYQFSLQGEHINTYNNIEEASIAVGVNRTGIIAVANFVQKTSGGFLWRYDDDIILKEDGTIEIKEINPVLRKRRSRKKD